MAIKKDPKKAIRIPGFFTCEQAAAELGMKPDTVRRYVHRGLIKTSMFGDVYVISNKDLQQFRRSRRTVGRPSNHKKTG